MERHIKQKSKKIVHVAGFLTVMMFLSRVLGYVRDIVLLSSFGQSYQTDAYYIAFNIPDFIYSILLGGALGSAFIPIFTSYLAKGQEEDSWIVASTVFNTILIAASILVAIGLLFTPQLIAFLAPGYDVATQELAVFLTRIMFLQCIFLCMSGILQGISWKVTSGIAS